MDSRLITQLLVLWNVVAVLKVIIVSLIRPMATVMQIVNVGSARPLQGPRTGTVVSSGCTIGRCSTRIAVRRRPIVFVAGQHWMDIVVVHWNIQSGVDRDTQIVGFRIFSHFSNRIIIMLGVPPPGIDLGSRYTHKPKLRVYHRLFHVCFQHLFR